MMRAAPLRGLLAVSAIAAVALSLAGIGSSTPPGRNGLIAFSFDGRGAGTALRGKPPGIAVVRPDGSGARLLIPNGRSPAWSPYGRRLAFVRSGNVFVMNANERVQRLTTLRRDDAPAWSPDGRRIAFVRAIGTGESQRSALMIMNADGRHKWAVYYPTTGHVLQGPSWSPDGTLIAFSNVSGGLGTIMVVGHLGGAQGHEWAPAGGDEDDYDPDWSPDRKHLAITRANWLCGSCDVDSVSLVRTDGVSPTRQLIENASNPSWAPDGNWIVAESPEGLIVTDLDGNSRRLFPSSGTEPAWQPLPA